MAAKTKTIEEVEKFIFMVAKHQGWKVVKDPLLFQTIAEGLKTNFAQYGYFQCPCRDSWGDREHDADIICPCVYCAPDIEEYGHCFCALFQSEAFFDSNQEPGSIPERRPEERYP